MLGLTELVRAARVIDEELAGARIERVVQPVPTDLTLALAGGGTRAPGARSFLRLVCDAKGGRVSAPRRAPRAPDTPPAFGQYLRAHLKGGRLRGAAVRGADRQLALAVETREGRFTLLLSLLGARGNLYLLDAEDRLVRASRPLAETRAELAPGEPWRDPAGGPPREGEDRFAQVPDAELLAAVEAPYVERAAQAVVDELGRRLGVVEAQPMPAKGARTLTGAKALQKSAADGEPGGVSLSKSEVASVLTYMNLRKGITDIDGARTSDIVAGVESVGIDRRHLQAVQDWLVSHPSEAEAAKRF